MESLPVALQILIVVLFFPALYSILIALVVLGERVQRAIRARREPRATFGNMALEPTQPGRSRPEDWSLALLVRVDEEAGRFAPSVQLQGDEAALWACIRLELVDEQGDVRFAASHRVPRSAAGTEFPLSSFLAPDDAGVEEVLRWRWDLVLEDRHGESLRLRKRLREAGRLNAEAELEPAELVP